MPTIPDPSASVSIPRETLAKAQRLATVGVSAASAAHEINNLLTAPLSYFQLSAKHPDDHELREKAIQCANRALDTIRQISESMLDFASRKKAISAVDVKSTAKAAISLL
ncbi:MAG TPA: histidine kinase dimerization/phospho-acceptor domain-containing protein, partial [Phycisphaerales bacterium]|nr:histidine kinase dimerization/phospho-acceptor domain-containing protein [Phycisphaerales bacterium]